jgi:hypothetical protein
MKLEVPYKVVGSIDVGLTNAIADKIEDSDWLVYDYRKSMGFTDCNSILLRHSSEYSSDTIRDMPLMDKFRYELEAVVKHLENFYDFTEQVSFMAKLEPKGKIHRHQDSGEFLERIHRVHIPLITNNDCFYIVDEVELNMQVGTVYEIDNTRIHGVVNNGDDYRIHLVINLYPKDENV